MHQCSKMVAASKLRHHADNSPDCDVMLFPFVIRLRRSGIYVCGSVGMSIHPQRVNLVVFSAASTLG